MFLFAHTCCRAYVNFVLCQTQARLPVSVNDNAGDSQHFAPERFVSFQPVLQDWCNKGCGMCYSVCGMMHIKEPLSLIGKSSPCGGSGFPLSLSEWSFTMCPTPYNRK